MKRQFKLEKCKIDMKTVTKLLVGPPASRGHSLKSHHKLNTLNSP